MPTHADHDVEVALGLLRKLKFDPFTDAISDEMRIAYKALSKLSPPLQGVLVLHFVEGRGIRMIASMKGCGEPEVIKACESALDAYIAALRRFTCDNGGQRKHAGRPAPASQKSRAEGTGSRRRSRKGRKAASPTEKFVAPLTKEAAYGILQISPCDSFAAKRNAYLQAIKRVHPDRVFTRGAKIRERAENMSKLINEAWILVKAEVIPS
jgi:hypothetical protein